MKAWPIYVVSEQDAQEFGCPYCSWTGINTGVVAGIDFNMVICGRGICGKPYFVIDNDVKLPRLVMTDGKHTVNCLALPHPKDPNAPLAIKLLAMPLIPLVECFMCPRQSVLDNVRACYVRAGGVVRDVVIEFRDKMTKQIVDEILQDHPNLDNEAFAEEFSRRIDVILDDKKRAAEIDIELRRNLEARIRTDLSLPAKAQVIFDGFDVAHFLILVGACEIHEHNLERSAMSQKIDQFGKFIRPDETVQRLPKLSDQDFDNLLKDINKKDRDSDNEEESDKS